MSEKDAHGLGYNRPLRNIMHYTMRKCMLCGHDGYRLKRQRWRTLTENLRNEAKWLFQDFNGNFLEIQNGG